MPRGPAMPAARQVRSLLALGAIGTHGDDDLIRHFLGRGPAAQDAFSALVDRHGPMVLAACRRSLGDTHAAEDAFQATFLVLSRRASTISPRAPLAAWLHGVAVRVASEARRSSIRRQRREERSMPPATVEDSRREDIDTLAILDEELASLPDRYRAALVLCELEGRSRRDAAASLNIAEGTLSSRLARGRTLLKARLIRRGVAPAAALMATSTADASVPLSLAAATVASAMNGNMPAGVALLAGRVVKVMFLSKLKPSMVLLLLAGTVGLGVQAGIPRRDDPRPVVADQGVVTTSHLDATARGVVVDEAGRPVAGAEVRCESVDETIARGTAGPDGTFSIVVPRARLANVIVTADDRVGDRIGVRLFELDGDDLPPGRVVVKPCRRVVVEVVDSAGKPVAGAGVEAVGQGYPIFEATTGSDGIATLRTPADARAEAVLALKPGVGVGCAQYGPRDYSGADRTVPGRLTLTLDGGKTIRLRAKDRTGAPLPGLDFGLYGFNSQVVLDGKITTQRVTPYGSRLCRARTDSHGVATFDWLPESVMPTFIKLLDGPFTDTEVRVDHADFLKGHVVDIRLLRKGTITGRVVGPDGTPAAGVKLLAEGTGHGRDPARTVTVTAADGTFRMLVPAEDVYAVAVDDPARAASTRHDVVVREAGEAAGVDFRLGTGTVIRGVATGPGGLPVAGQRLKLIERVRGRAPRDRFDVQFLPTTEVDRFRQTDSQGRYAFRVAPGAYTLHGPTGFTGVEITVGDEAEVVRDLRLSKP